MSAELTSNQQAKLDEITQKLEEQHAELLEYGFVGTPDSVGGVHQTEKELIQLVNQARDLEIPFRFVVESIVGITPQPNRRVALLRWSYYGSLPADEAKEIANKFGIKGFNLTDLSGS